MSAPSGSGGSSTAHRPTAREYIIAHLVKFGRSTNHEMATSPIHRGYSQGHICRTAVNLMEAGIIEGEQTVEILSCEINGYWIILNSNRARIIRDLERCAPHLATQARSMTLDEIHDLVQNNADKIGTLGGMWEFWVDPTTFASSSSQGPSGAAADD